MQLIKYIFLISVPSLVVSKPVEGSLNTSQTPGFCAHNGTKDVDSSSTQFCCGMDNQPASWSVVVKRCMPYGGPAGGLKGREFDACCLAQGKHSEYKP
jgi:hypothetical protein